MDINKLKEIFIEEANEIIEKMDVDIINFEENPSDKELLNELFRGVHTLKGSANSFGFSRLGEFVHHFEDVLDYYRNSDDEVTSDSIDIFLEAVDLIKEVMVVEVDGTDELPPNYEACLESIKQILGKGDEPTSSENESELAQSDLALEFAQDESSEQIQEVDTEALLHQVLEGESLYHIRLQTDVDLFFRGYDHGVFFKLLSKEGNILESFWNMSKIPPIEDIDMDISYIGAIDIYFASKLPLDEVKEIFEYLEESEYTIHKIQNTPPQEQKPQEIVQTPTPQGVQKEKPKEEPKQSPTANDAKRPPMKKKVESHSYVKIDTHKLDELFDSIGELVIAQNFLAEEPNIKNIKNENVTKTLNTLSKITRLIQNRVMSLRMVPIQDTFEKMKRVVRDASKKVGKEINLTIEGADTEIDKTMIDSLSDPLIHIIRNAIDHGIEDNINERIAKNKSGEGNVMLKAFHRGGSIAIEISDDGRGINKEKVLNKAIQRELVDENEDLSDAQIFSLIMQAGFSTADQISDISGRGVGLDVVRTSIEKLNGKVEISSEVGKGSTFTILLPLTLAIIDGMLVRSEQDTYIIPTLSVIESFIPQKGIVHSFKHKGEFVDLRGEMLPIMRLNKILDSGTSHPPAWESTLVCIESEKGKYALLIDDLIGRQQVVIKPLGPALSKVKELSGSAIMGNGEIALILNTEELFLPEANTFEQ